VAVVTVVDVVSARSALLRRPEQYEHICGPVCFLLSDIVRVDPPIPCKGKLGLWTVPDDIVGELERRGIRATA
jgi:hypothetical protein